MAHRKTKVFVSYSRHDESLVKPLAGLLGVASDDAVFLDVSSLKPGDLWEEKIIGAVKEASVFVLCWCCQSQESTFVAKEIDAALAAGKKRLVPVLFCSTKLPDNMADRQWIDLRGRIVHVCNHPADPAAPSVSPPTAPTAPASAPSPPAQAASTPPKHVPRDASGRKLYRVRPDSKPQPAKASMNLFVRISLLIGLVLLLATAGLLSYRSVSHSANAGITANADMTIVLLIAGLLLGLILVVGWLALRPKIRAVGQPEHEPEDIIARRARSYFEGLGL